MKSCVFMLKPKNRIVILGGSGMVGKALLKRLESKGYKVLAVARKDKNCCRGDVADINFLEKILKKEDIIYYLVTENRSKNFRDYHKANVLGLKNLVEIDFKLKFKKIIYISTTMVLRKNIKKNNFYVRSKLEGLKYFKKNFKYNYYIVYPGVVINRNFRYREKEKGMWGAIKDYLGFNTQGGIRMMVGNRGRLIEMIYIDELIDMLEDYLTKNRPREKKAVTKSITAHDYVKMASSKTRFWPIRMPEWISKYFLN
ncbi:hypothetical protein COY20_01495 [Candidatus Shapirobacteria bacterium CG_4_10_14_0_2_um_filter_40_12]|uniref:NAD-dependent epimerase/dehydratase domain-containing protein n=1 Tax=Candidatus Shapirobacteria bacterium CG_4_10_14_0_2_um_filter_40_12 TaxID=1974871 RepID=A0A2M7TTM8_9BACT|nr:MAG: hypothetical protein COY20_01495 [Candidatus Shapirobacteria bacterium CG_4_10_14_0_2_um_filter_40_12]